GARDTLRHDDDEILDPDAEGASLVIARFVRQDHARMERLLGSGLSARWLGYSLRPFVDCKIGTDAMVCAMRVIDTVRPQILPRENIELAAARPLGEARRCKRNVALEYLGESAAHLR